MNLIFLGGRLFRESEKNIFAGSFVCCFSMKNSKVLIGIAACVSVLALSTVALSRGGAKQGIERRANAGVVHMLVQSNPGDNQVVEAIRKDIADHPGRQFISGFARPGGEVDLIFIGG